jgi:excisionase family DNA binding protein
VWISAPLAAKVSACIRVALAMGESRRNGLPEPVELVALQRALAEVASVPAQPVASSSVPVSPSRETEMTCEEAAVALGCSRQTVRRWAASGELPGRHAGHSWLFDPAVIRARAADRTVA